MKHLNSDCFIKSDRQLTVANASFTILDQTANSKFGYPLQIIPPFCIHSTAYPALMISAPADMGKLFVYEFQPEPRLILTLEGLSADYRFGQSFTIHQDRCWLAVGFRC